MWIAFVVSRRQRNFGGCGRTLDPGWPGPARRGAAGFPGWPGRIDHALRVTLPGGDVNPQYVYPGSHMVNESQGANNLPLGGRLRLANTPAIDALISEMPPESQIIATAMQQYGLIVADIGSAMYVTGSSAIVDNVDSPDLDLTWNPDDIFASNGLEALNAGDFQVVNLDTRGDRPERDQRFRRQQHHHHRPGLLGAAGHLSVFFGTTAASSVTFVSDSTLTAAVPSGAGTLNVTVQSGVVETDDISDSPKANVNQPIFGYGTSAISAADQFTYSSQTIIGANSTVGFASPTAVSGTIDVLIIVVKDTTGNAVSGLASSAFGFALSGGTSAGTFGAVTATATPGTYTASFTFVHSRHGPGYRLSLRPAHQWHALPDLCRLQQSLHHNREQCRPVSQRQDLYL